VKDGSLKIDPEVSEIMLDGKTVSYRDKVYYILNKPQGYVCATEDKKEKTVLDLLSLEDRRKDIFPAGRLDKDTVGLLIMTTDGPLSHKLLSPKHHAEKIYYVECDKEFTDSDIAMMWEGIMMDGKKTKPALLKILEDRKCAEITLTEGKFHEIKRLCYAAGQKEVLYLKRLYFAGLTLDESLSEGEWRELTSEEIEILKKN
jgi:16S rRNA pseudouridine516 synthase